MATTREIAVSNLLLDAKNPRLPEDVEGQPDLIRGMTGWDRDKSLALASDIVSTGLNPTEALIVMPASDDPKRFVVLEGNRRVTALKMLEDPKLVDGIYGATLRSRLNDLHRKFQTAPIRKVTCYVVDTREDADAWIDRRHEGERGGVGIVPWNATERQRRAARRGKGATTGYQALEFVQQHGELDDATLVLIRRRFPVTILDRILNDEEVRKPLGLGIEDKVLTMLFPPEQTVRALKRMVLDILHKRVKTPHVETDKERREYIAGFRRNELPEAKARLDRPVTLAGEALGSPASGSSSASKKPTGKRASNSPATRETLAPPRLRLTIDKTRIAAIFAEMQRLKVTPLTNAAAVMLRVFLDLSVVDYTDAQGLIKPEEVKITLNTRTERAITHLAAAGKLDRQAEKSVKRAVSKDSWVASSTKTLHEFVHNPHFHPSPREMTVAWDNLEPLFKAIWS
jgi:hypothetical protein